MEKAIPAEDRFHLSKVKLNKSGGIEARYSITEMNDGESLTTECQIGMTREVHPDLKDLFAKLCPLFTRVFLTEADCDLGEAEEKINVRSLTITDKSVIMTADVETQNGATVPVNTPRIIYENNGYGFEEELLGIITDIRSEVYQYLYRGKQAQLSLFGDNVTGEQLVEEQAILDEAEDE